MSSHDEQRRFLADRFTQIVLGIPVKMPNTPFDIPKNAPYGEFHILGNAEPIPIGGEGSGKIRERTVGWQAPFPIQYRDLRFQFPFSREVPPRALPTSLCPQAAARPN